MIRYVILSGAKNMCEDDHWVTRYEAWWTTGGGAKQEGSGSSAPTPTQVQSANNT